MHIQVKRGQAVAARRMPRSRRRKGVGAC
jgi:hypothetical protein